MRKRFLRIGEHLVKGSPVKPGGQLQIGLWFITLQRAWSPHVPGQGFIHLWLLHAWFWGHSELTTHSGLHVGGLPMYPVRHEHTACPLVSRHWLFGPQGDGLHGCVTGGTVGRGWKQNKVKRRKATVTQKNNIWKEITAQKSM
jgi:hypothetical protein